MDTAESAPSISESRRLLGTFHEPGVVFADIASHGRWWIPLLIIILLSSLSVHFMVSRIGYDRMIQKAFDASPQIQQMSADQRERAFETQRKIMPYAVRVGPVAATVIGVLIIAAALLFTFKFLLDADLKYKQVLNITSYASLPAAVVGAAAMILVLFLKPPDDFDINSPLAFNLGAFLPEGAAKWLHSLAASFDLFTLWTIVLVAVGFSAVCGAKKMPFGRALVGVVAPWLLWVVAKVAWAAMFS
jgi:hypothetical protein